MNLTIKEIVEAVQALGAAAEPFLGQGAISAGAGGATFSTGISAPDNDGLVELAGIEALRQRCIDAQFPHVAAALPKKHLLDWWNPKEQDALETLNDAYADGKISQKALWLLNGNLNRLFFLSSNLGKSVVPKFNVNPVQTIGWGAWSVVKVGVPDSPVWDVVPSEEKRYPWKLDQSKAVPGAYLWFPDIPANDSFPTAYWSAWVEAMTGGKVK